MKMRVRELTMHDVDLPFSRTPVGNSDKGSLPIRLMQHRKSICGNDSRPVTGPAPIRNIMKPRKEPASHLAVKGG